MKVKSVVVVNDFNYTQGGASKVAIDTANLLTESIENVYFFSASEKKSNELNKKVREIYTSQGEVIKDKNKIRGIINGIYNFKAKKIFSKLLSQLNPDETIIHIHGWTKCLSSSVFNIAFKKKYKTVLTLHDYFSACPNGGFFNYKNYEICKLKPMSWKCIKCNCDSRNYGFKIYRIVRQFVQNKIVKLPYKLQYAISISQLNEGTLKKFLNKNIVLKKIYNPFDSNKILNINAKENEIFLYVGRVCKEKGTDIFCRAVIEAQKDGIVIGDGPELEVLKKQYPDIHFTGWITQEQMLEFYKRAKAVIVPSRWYEGAPLVPFEAAKYNIPCITTKCCAAREFVPKRNVYSSFEELVNMIKNNDFSFEVVDIENQYLDNITSFYSEIVNGRV